MRLLARWPAIARSLFLVPLLAAAPARAEDAPQPPSAPSEETQAEAPDERGTQDYLADYRIQLDWNPLGVTIPGQRFRFSNFIPMHPAGFRGDFYQRFFAPTYAVGRGWEVTAGVTGAERLGPGGTALFYGAGFQKQFITESRSRPGVSFGAYGMFGPHNHNSGTLFLATSKKLWGRKDRAVFLHAGGRLETYGSDDYGSGTGLRPYVGTSFAFSRRAFLSAEFSPRQPWDRANMYSARLAVRLYRGFGIQGGIRSNGYRTLPFIGIIL